MKSCSTNDIKIYNLSSGKSLPEWITERKKRLMQNKKGDKKSIELIQDFDMPGVSTGIQMTPDGNYILATGIYKPRIKCYDVSNLALKFERCLDSEIVKFIVLSEDYGKIAFLQCDRYLEFHAQGGRYYRTRIPKFGRDLVYHSPSCDLVIVGATNEVFRLNLELGRFSTPLITESKTVNRCVVNPVHHLLVFGTEEGHVEAWDQRTSKRVGVLDTAFSSITESTEIDGIPSVTALTFKDGLTLGVGTATGQILLYDIRSSKPLLVKDHYYSLPIKDIEFHKEENMVMSMDNKIVKIWEEQTGKPYTAVEEESDFNDLCYIPKTGMFFVANEDKKILTYYVPSLGPAPKWCSFIDSLAEELEESNVQTIYDDYKFVSERELHDIGLGHLIGTNLLRGYMHGYFMDMRLYRKAKSVMEPFNFGEFKKKKIRERLDNERSNRVKLNTLPSVNRELALKLMSEPETKKKKKTENLLQDDRFKVMFQNPDFEVDKSAEEYRLLNPVLSKMEKRKMTKLESVFEPIHDDEMEGKASSDEGESSSDDDDRDWVQQMREEKKKIRNERQLEESKINIEPKFYEIKTGEELKLGELNSNKRNKLSKITLGERAEAESKSEIKTKGPLGSREMSFEMRSRGKKRDPKKEAYQHHKERRQIRRSAGGLKNKKNSWKKS